MSVSDEVKAEVFIMLSNLRVPKMGCYIIALLAQLERDDLMHGENLHALLLRENKGHKSSVVEVRKKQLL